MCHAISDWPPEILTLLQCSLQKSNETVDSCNELCFHCSWLRSPSRSCGERKGQGPRGVQNKQKIPFPLVFLSALPAGMDRTCPPVRHRHASPGAATSATWVEHLCRLLWGCQTCPVGWSRSSGSQSLSLPSARHTPLTPYTCSQLGQGLPLPKFQNFSPPPVPGINTCQWHRSLQRFHMG